MIFEALAQYVETNKPGYVCGTNIFINQAPEGPLPLILFRDPAGAIKIDGEIPIERSGRFQMIVRGEAVSAILPLGRELSTLLTAQGLDLGNVFVKVLRPLHEPLPYQRSEGGAFEISVNFAVSYGIVI